MEKKKKLIDKNGSERDVDIYWEYELLGQIFKTAVECKDYERRISIDKIEAFATKIKNLGLNKGIFATKKGYQCGAIETAKGENISLILVRDIENKSSKFTLIRQYSNY